MKVPVFRLALLAVALAPTAAAQMPLRVMAVDAPPQSRAEDERGIMSDAMMEALRRAGLEGKLEFPPWPRAQEEAQAGKDILIIALSRTPARENKYTWIYPVLKLDRAFATTGRQVSSFAEARENFHQIAVALRSAQYDILLKEGFTTDQFSTLLIERQEKIPTLLVMGRVDAWFSSIAEIKYAIRGNADAANVVIGPPVGDGTLQYLACSLDCNPDLVAKLRQAAVEMKMDGTMDAIVAMYQ
jgi:polar amino acid transport system substrate-binding protein